MKKKRMISLHTHISKSRHVVNLICTIFSQIFSTPPKLPIKPTQVCSQPVLVGRLEKRLLLPQYRNCIGHLFLAKIRNKFFQFFDVFFFRANNFVVRAQFFSIICSEFFARSVFFFFYAYYIYIVCIFILTFLL